MNILQGVLAWTAKRKRQGFVLLALLLLGAGLFTFNAPKAYASGGGCSCFVHTSTTANTLYNYTVLDDSPFSLASPQLEIFVTHNWGSRYGIYNPHPLGVMYIGTHWAIFNEDRAAMPVGLYFNVYLGGACGPVVTATTDNTFNDYTLLPNTGDFSLNSIMLVTANLEPNEVYDPHPLGVWYTGTQWSVFNEDGAAMPIGASFNVACYSFAVGTPTTAVLGSNAFGDYVLINQSIDNSPSAKFLVTANWEPNEVYDPHPLGVWYTGSQWAIFNEDGVAMPAGASFNVSVLA